MSSYTDIEKKQLVLNYCQLRMGQITRGDVVEVATRCGYLTANGHLSESGRSRWLERPSYFMCGYGNDAGALNFVKH